MIEYENFIDSPFNDWQEIDTIVSRDCTLRCEYCYLQKHPDASYDVDAVIASVDKLLTQAEEANKEGVVLSFYPEPWANIPRSNELIFRCLELLTKHPKYLSNYMIMLGTNGVKLDKQIPILKQLEGHVSIAVTIDGIKEQHDKYRVFPDGSPSWEIVKRNILSNQNKYGIYSTKVTLGPDTLQYIVESSRFLWDEMHFKDINMNVVYEDLWGDKLEECLELFEQQLQLLYEDIISNKRWEKEQYQSLLGTRQIPRKWIGEDTISSNKPYCGAGVMRSVDSDGTIYPCFRFSPYALNERKDFAIEKNEIARSFKLLNNVDTIPEMCKDCDIFSACSMCVGGAVEEKGSLYARTTHHCEFQKLQSKYAMKLYEAINESIL